MTVETQVTAETAPVTLTLKLADSSAPYARIKTPDSDSSLRLILELHFRYTCSRCWDFRCCHVLRRLNLGSDQLHAPMLVFVNKGSLAPDLNRCLRRLPQSAGVRRPVAGARRGGRFTYLYETVMLALIP